MLILEGSIGLLAVGIGWALGDPPAERIHWTVDAAIDGVAATAPLVGVMWLCMRAKWRPFRELRDLIDQKVVPIFAGSRMWEFAAIAAVAGLGEEMLFRGVIQSFLARLLSAPAGTLVALMVASILFGLLHWLTPLYALLAGAISLYLGTVWILTNNLLVPALAHALYDFWALVYLVRLRNAGSSGQPR
jgi:uncharacterized protein